MVVTWSYPFEKNEDRYSTGTVEVDVEITFFFPKRDVPKDAPLDLVGNWNAYLNALHEHENGHRDITVAAACEILQELKSLASCNT